MSALIAQYSQDTVEHANTIYNTQKSPPHSLPPFELKVAGEWTKTKNS